MRNVMYDMNIKTTQIAGWKTIDDWRMFRPSLLVGSNPSSWQEAYKEYFLTRLDLRYFNPIRILQEHGTFQDNSMGSGNRNKVLTPVIFLR